MPKGRSKRRPISRKAKRILPATAKEMTPKRAAEGSMDRPAEVQEGEAIAAPQKMNPKSQGIVLSLMGTMLVAFLLIAVLAPDPTSPQGRPGGGTVFWRLLFLLIPLGIMYGLLWWEKVLKLIGR